MKRAWCLLTLVLTASAGCLETPVVRRETKIEPPPKLVEQKPAQPPARPPAPAAVTADQVTEANALAKAKALEEELTRDEQDHWQANVPVPKEANKP
jgi:hypothetical protein